MKPYPTSTSSDAQAGCGGRRKRREKMLEASEIPFVVVGDGLQDLFGIGRLTGGTNFITGPVQIRVTQDDAEDALEILADMEKEDDE